MRIVFGSANYWTSPYQVGSHAWARLFAGHGWDVSYLSDPLTPWHFVDNASRRRNQERLRLWGTGGDLFENGRIRAWVPMSLVAPQNAFFFRKRMVLNRWHHTATPSIVRTLKKWGADQPDLLWLDSVRHAGWGGALQPRKSILRVADWSAGFGALPASVLMMEREWMARADLVIATAESLADRIGPFRKGGPLKTIRNGVDVAFWQRESDLPREYEKVSRPRIIYVGALDQWFDLPLLMACARALPDASFFMVGSAPSHFVSTATASNIHWLGPRSRNEVQPYVAHADVGIIPFKRNELIECVCPLKLYEYMACGLPVVATRWDELERMRSPAALASSIEEWIASLREALVPNETRRTSVRRFACDNDWSCRWEELQKLIPF